MALFDRVASLTVGQSGGKGILIKDLRFSFNIEKSSTETLNSSTVKIYNLNPDNRRLVETPNNALILKAGYAQDIGSVTIFTGIVRRSLTVREGVDWVTELEMDDGLIAYRDAQLTVGFAPGISAIAVLNYVSGQFNLPVRPLPSGIKDKTYPNGFPAVGKVRTAMNKVCNFLGLEWSIQNQEIQILTKGGVAKRTAIVVSGDSGMIGSPSLEAKTMSEAAAAKKGISTNTAGVIKRTPKTDKDGKTRERLEIQGYKVKMLLSPTMEPGGIVQLKSEGIDGEFFRVEKLSHIGDTMGGEWQTEASLRFI